MYFKKPKKKRHTNPTSQRRWACVSGGLLFVPRVSGRVIMDWKTGSAGVRVRKPSHVSPQNKHLCVVVGCTHIAVSSAVNNQKGRREGGCSKL